MPPDPLTEPGRQDIAVLDPAAAHQALAVPEKTESHEEPPHILTASDTSGLWGCGVTVGLTSQLLRRQVDGDLDRIGAVNHDDAESCRSHLLCLLEEVREEALLWSFFLAFAKKSLASFLKYPKIHTLARPTPTRHRAQS
ncbi:hypothetical protein NDU88_006832 [Pleurodeles waltl]|uniref:Uncharacterized protein n=1 Tax=Pleurodeles waltl TaxID=8319 RepID=A0AAV7MED3_PLEWA|nr:hypothetical protein NDU88_006832 [Pleurodeles waltl]